MEVGELQSDSVNRIPNTFDFFFFLKLLTNLSQGTKEYSSV